MARGGQLTKKEASFLDMLFREWNEFFKDYIPTVEETDRWYNTIFLPSLRTDKNN